MIQRRTQTEQYWQEHYEVSSEDLGHIYDIILDRGQPTAVSDLVGSIIELRCRREEAGIQAELDRGDVYQPQDRFAIGQQVLFPQFELALGTVVGSRTASNPEYGVFTAIQVRIEGEEAVREFASGLVGEHKLNRSPGEPDPSVLGELYRPDELQRRFGPTIERKLVAALAAHEEFTRFGNAWYLRELLVPVSVGQLNIAEALIEIKSMPLPTQDLLPDLDLPAEVTEQIKILSLNKALEADGRFNNIGDSGRDIWYLRRLTPRPVVDPPTRLVLRSEQFDREAIAAELLLLERDIDDVGSVQEAAGSSRAIYRCTIVLPFPYWRHGTLPLTAKTQGLFPESTQHHSPIILVDGQTGDRMQGWVVHGGSFIYGLAEWYKRHSLPAGAIVKLERTRDARVITVDYEPDRLKRLWIPVASVRDQSLVFQLRKRPVSCRFDEHMLMDEDSPQAVAQLWQVLQERGTDLRQLMLDIFPELIKLSPQATVHAKTVYSAVNVLRRTAPGPIFSCLSSEPCYVAMGGGYWTFDDALAGKGVG